MSILLLYTPYWKQDMGAWHNTHASKCAISLSNAKWRHRLQVTTRSFSFLDTVKRRPETIQRRWRPNSDFLLLSLSSSSCLLGWCCVKMLIARFWYTRRSSEEKPHDSSVTNPIFMNFRCPPTEEEIQQALRERRMRRRRQIVAKFTSAYKRGNSLPCHVCCQWSTSQGCPCCSNRMSDVMKSKQGFNFQTAATLR